MRYGLRRGGLGLDQTLPERLIDAIYDAALDRALWREALAAIGAMFGGVPTQLAVWDLATGAIPLGIGVEFMDGVWEIARRYATLETNPTLALAGRIPLHRAVDHGANIGFDRFKSLAVYEALYRPQAIMPLIATVVARSAATFGGFAVMRPDHWAPAELGTLALGARISRHVGRAVALAGMLDFRRDASNSFEVALSQTHMPTFLLNGEHAVVWTNAAADDLLGEPGGLSCRRRRLVASNPADDAELALALTAAARDEEAMAIIRRQPPSSPLVVRIFPLWRSQVRSGARILVQVTEARARFRFDAQQAADLFGLTPAEARVACELCAGARSLADVAKALTITVNTVKTLLQRVYDKTGVRSQEELVGLLAAVLRPIGAIPK